jgi:hypothetical protein
MSFPSSTLISSTLLNLTTTKLSDSHGGAVAFLFEKVLTAAGPAGFRQRISGVRFHVFHAPA